MRAHLVYDVPLFSREGDVGDGSSQGDVGSSQRDVGSSQDDVGSSQGEV
jgi:hypothetical protein